MNAFTRPDTVRERQVIAAAEVAAMLGYRCRESFTRKIAALEASNFPRRLPGLNGWSKPAIMRWLETNGESHEPAPEEQGVEKSPLARRFA